MVIVNYCKLLLCIYICIKVIRQLYVYVIMSLYVTMSNIIICSIIMMFFFDIITIIIIVAYSCYMCSVYCHNYFLLLSLSMVVIVICTPLFSSWQLERPQESFSGATSRAQALLASLVYMMETAMDLKIYIRYIFYISIFIYIDLCGFI